MDYIALSYIGQEFTPGEIIPSDALPENTIERLLRAGAIREDAPKPARKPEAPEPEPQAGPEAEAEAHEETYEEPEAPEIDVTAGIVEEPEVKKSRTRRKGGKA